MSELKQNLVTLIEAYAASKITDNKLLQTFAAEKLTEFLKQIEIIETPTVEPNEG